MAPDCYNCEYRRGIPGSAHSRCVHPSLKKATDNPGLELLSIFGSIGRTPPINLEDNKIHVTGDEYGISQGWFQFPWNFDPVWLKTCEGFKLKEG